MAISSTFGTGVSGINTFQSGLTVVSNNIANTDTVAFKENDISFSELVAKGIGKGKFQIGQGVTVNSVFNRFTQGELDRTRTSALDLAIEGNGFFVMQDPFGSTVPLFTRAGVFTTNAKGLVVNPDGFLLQGTKVTIDPVTGVRKLGEVAPIDLSTSTSPPRATTLADFVINLYSGDPDPITVVNGTEPTLLDPNNPLQEGALIINGASFGEIGGATAEERIANLIEAINNPNTVEITGVTAGNATPLSIQLTHVNGGAINVEFESSFDPEVAEKTGLKSGTFVPEGSKVLTGGVIPTTGSKTVKGTGTRFTHELIAGDAVVIETTRYTVESVQSDTELTLLKEFVKPGTDLGTEIDSVKAVGQSGTLSTSISFFDSLGTERLVNVRFRKLAANEWEWSAVVDKKDNRNGDFDQVQARGILSFAPDGQLDSSKAITTDYPTGGFDFKGILPPKAGEVPLDPSIDPVDPTSNQKVAFDFTGATQYAERSGSVVLTQTQDGFSAGLLQSISVDAEGVINGLFTNGTIQPLYQLTMALFPNQDGLTRIGGNLYTQSDISGEQIQASAGQGGRGRILSKALEVSTVDLTVQFVKLITYQRGFQANSRVITTSDEVLQEVVNLKR